MLLVPVFLVLPYLYFQPRGPKEHYSYAHECTVFNTGNFSHSIDNFASCDDALDSSNVSVNLQLTSCCKFPNTADSTYIATNKFSFCLKLLHWSRPLAFSLWALCCFPDPGGHPENLSFIEFGRFPYQLNLRQIIWVLEIFPLMLPNRGNYFLNPPTFHCAIWLWQWITCDIIQG